jgi:hypothetical protein
MTTSVRLPSARSYAGGATRRSQTATSGWTAPTLRKPMPRITVGQHCATGRPRARGDRFPRSAQEPGPRSRHLHAGHHLGSQQASPRLIPGPQTVPGFDATRCFSTRHQWFACARLRDPHLPRSVARLFPRRSPPRLLTAAARGGLRPRLHGDRGGPPVQQPRLLHLLHSTASGLWSSTSSLLQRSWSHVCATASPADATGVGTTRSVVVQRASAPAPGLKTPAFRCESGSRAGARRAFARGLSHLTRSPR